MGESQLAYVGIGSNLEQPLVQVQAALRALARVPRSQLVANSPPYLSAPMGPTDQPDFVNAVAALRTGLQPLELLDRLQEIEQRQGRVRTGRHWGPRIIDLDLLLFGDEVIEHPRLTVPHLGVHQRAFVLYPLADIAPDLVIPGHGSVRTLLARCPAEQLKKLDDFE